MTITLNTSYNDIVGYIEAGKSVYAKVPFEIQEESGYSESGYEIYPCVGYSIVHSFDDEGEPKTTYQVIFIGMYGNIYAGADTPNDNLTYMIDSNPYG